MVDIPAEWLAALERRHLADLTATEIARALRALSSCYVERRARLAAGGALDTRGKRAAFALFYGPAHFILTRLVIQALPQLQTGPREILDLGCGTGVAGAAWALEIGGARIAGIDRHRWVVAEANRTYADLHVHGRARQADISRLSFRTHPGSGIVLAYTLNELSGEHRDLLRAKLLAAQVRGARILVMEPIARRMAPWWNAWRESFERAGGRADEWRFPGSLPPRQRALARAAGLDPRELTARTLCV